MASKLYNELTTGPLAAQITPLMVQGSLAGDATIANILNAQNIASTVPIMSKDIEEYLLLHGHWASIMGGTSAPCVTMAKALNAFQSFDMTVTPVATMIGNCLDGLVADQDNVPSFTAADKAAILAFGMTTISRAKQLDIEVTPYLVTQARVWKGE